MNVIAILNPENASDGEVASYDTREAARAIVFDKDGKIAVLKVSKRNYYKLPGGGLESGEDALAGLKRECREEIGCEIETTGEIGTIIEYRKMFKSKQVSYCYRAKVVGEKGAPQFMDDEIEDGYRVEWVMPEEAEKLLCESKPTDRQGGPYIVPRELVILRVVKKTLTKA